MIVCGGWRNFLRCARTLQRVGGALAISRPIAIAKRAVGARKAPAPGDREHRVARRRLFQIASRPLKTHMLHMRDRRRTMRSLESFCKDHSETPAAAAISRTDRRSGNAFIDAATAMSTTEPPPLQADRLSAELVSRRAPALQWAAQYSVKQRLPFHGRPAEARFSAARAAT
jgi:hypothetical protein